MAQFQINQTVEAKQFEGTLESAARITTWIDAVGQGVWRWSVIPADSYGAEPRFALRIGVPETLVGQGDWVVHFDGANQYFQRFSSWQFQKLFIPVLPPEL